MPNLDEELNKTLVALVENAYYHVEELVEKLEATQTCPPDTQAKANTFLFRVAEAKDLQEKLHKNILDLEEKIRKEKVLQTYSDKELLNELAKRTNAFYLQTNRKVTIEEDGGVNYQSDETPFSSMETTHVLAYTTIPTFTTGTGITPDTQHDARAIRKEEYKQIEPKAKPKGE